MTLESYNKIPCDFGGRRRLVRWVRFAAGALLLSSLFVVSPIIPVDLRFDVPILSQVLPQVEPVKADATCAQGGVCVVGDTGPGGGIVFYVASGGFNCGLILNGATKCNYLEAAPTSGEAAWTDASYAWSGTTNVAIFAWDEKTKGLGDGFKNTEAMVAQSATPNRAGTITRAYRGPNNLTDWHLPSHDELGKLYAQRSRVGGFSTAYYWSSSEIDKD